MDKLTVFGGDIFIDFGSADLDQGGQYVVDTFSEVVRGVNDKTAENGGSLDDLHVEREELVSVPGQPFEQPGAHQ